MEYPYFERFILTRPCQGGWIAYMKDQRGTWEFGETEAQAIGKLIITLSAERAKPTGE